MANKIIENEFGKWEVFDDGSMGLIEPSQKWNDQKFDINIIDTKSLSVWDLMANAYKEGVNSI